MYAGMPCYATRAILIPRRAATRRRHERFATRDTPAAQDSMRADSAPRE